MLLCLLIQRAVLNSFACNFQKRRPFLAHRLVGKSLLLSVELTIPLLIFATGLSMLLLANEHLGSLSANEVKAGDYKSTQDRQLIVVHSYIWTPNPRQISLKLMPMFRASTGLASTGETTQSCVILICMLVYVSNHCYSKDKHFPIEEQPNQ